MNYKHALITISFIITSVSVGFTLGRHSMLDQMDELMKRDAELISSDHRLKGAEADLEAANDRLMKADEQLRANCTELQKNAYALMHRCGIK